MELSDESQLVLRTAEAALKANQVRWAEVGEHVVFCVPEAVAACTPVDRPPGGHTIETTDGQKVLLHKLAKEYVYERMTPAMLLQRYEGR